MSHRLALLLAVAVFAVGCSSSKVSQISSLRPLDHPVNRVAVAPSGGVLGDAVGIVLLGGGVDVIDTQQTTNWMVRANLDEYELIRPENLTRLREEGADALLIVRTVAGYDDKPQSATVRVISTHNSSLVAGLSWQNGRGGARGSPADATMRKDIVDAAEEIGNAVLTQLRRP